MYADKDSYVRLLKDTFVYKNDTASLKLLESVDDVPLQYLQATFAPMLSRWDMVDMFDQVVYRLFNCLAHELASKLKVPDLMTVHLYKLGAGVHTRAGMPATEGLYTIVDTLMYGSDVSGNGLESFSVTAERIRLTNFGATPHLDYQAHLYLDVLKGTRSYVLPHVTDTVYSLGYMVDMLSISGFSNESDSSLQRTQPYWDLIFKSYSELKALSDEWAYQYKFNLDDHAKLNYPNCEEKE